MAIDIQSLDGQYFDWTNRNTLVTIDLHLCHVCGITRNVFARRQEDDGFAAWQKKRHR